MDSKKRSRKERKHKKRQRESRSRSRSKSRSPSLSGNESKQQHDDSAQASAPVKGDDQALSIEETNKLRALLGLKPLEVPTTASGGTSANAVTKSSGTAEVFVPTRNIGRDKETERIREKLDLTREKRRITEKVTDKPLAEDDTVDDITSWVQRSREKELAKQREKLLAEADEQAESVTDQEVKPMYTSRDLAGLKVQHSLEKISEERSVILTLKDKHVLGDGEDEEEGDVLENVNMAEDERTEINKANKKAAEKVSGFGVVRYNPYDDADGEESSLLGKYDEEIAGRKKSFFVLADSGGQDDTDIPRKPKSTAVKEEATTSIIVQPKVEVNMSPLEELRAKLKTQTNQATFSARPAMLATSSLNSSGPVLANEYYTPEEMAAKFKKVRKVKKPLRTLKADDLIEPEKRLDDGQGVPMEEDFKLPVAQLAVDNKSFDPDDAELKLSLDRSKRIREITSEVVSNGSKLGRRLPEHVAVDLLSQTTSNPTLSSAPVSDGSGWVMLNQTSEFCRGVGDLPVVEAAKDEVAPNGNGNVGDRMDTSSDSENEKIRKKRSATGRNYRKAEDSDGESSRRPKKQDSAPKKSDLKKVDLKQSDESSESGSEDEFVLGHEPKANSSVFEALRLASMKGYLEKQKGDASGGGTTAIGGKVAQLVAKNFLVEERNYGDIDAKFSGNRNRGGPRERLAGPVLDFCEKETYKPDVKIEYVDEAGKQVDAKEAFRLLSHRFHGKTSGKKKVEKKLRKEAQERRILSQSSSDTPLNMLHRLQQRQQKEKQAFVVLSAAGTSSSVHIPMPETNGSPAKAKPKAKKSS